MKVNSNPEDAMITSGRNISFWTDSLTPGKLNPLKENLSTDVVIVGGGIAGLSVAYCLTQSGKKVVLIEDGAIGSGETGRTTAHLMTALDNSYYDLVRVFGEDKTKLIAESHIAAINFVEDTIKKQKIDCGFERLNGASKIDHEGITTIEGFKVNAKHVVVATNNPVNNLFTMFEKQHGYRTYVIGAFVLKNSLPKALWWDTGDFEDNSKIPPYHYVRIHPCNEQYEDSFYYTRTLPVQNFLDGCAIHLDL